MRSCPEGAFTTGHLWMAALGGGIVILVVVMILLDRGMIGRRSPEG